MGLLIDGEWHDHWYDTKGSGGRFIRQQAPFRGFITPDGSPGASAASAPLAKEGGFVAEADRYHLYVSLACPWAHRTLIMRALKGLASFIPISVVHYHMGEHGWTFAEADGVIPDPNCGAHYLYEIYRAAQPNYSGRVTVPVLWDKRRRCIVNNESSEIIRMFGSAFDHLGARPGDYYPLALRPEIDAVNQRIYDTLNNGVYKAGFATTQAAYEESVYPLFATLDWLEERLAKQRYLVGPTLTEADIRLFTTLVRFDAVYVGHFKCNLRRLIDYPALWAYTRDIYQIPEVTQTVNFQHIKGHYYTSHPAINPTRVVPVGPLLDFNAPHDRERLP